MFTPPKTVIDVIFRWREYWVTLSSICAASSRVGASTRVRIVRRAPIGVLTGGFVLSSCRIGSVKPAVLPVPVWAPASRSPPESTTGMAWVWMGVGCV